VLSAYVDRPASDLELQQGDHGKPFLPDALDLGFNLSHSGNVALLAISWGRDVGADVETVRDPARIDALVRRCLTLREREEWMQLPSAQRAAAFFRWWTCKEAYLKAIGTGFTFAAQDCDVDALAQEPRLRETKHHLPAERWWLSHLDVEPGIAAAICVEGKPPSLNVWLWNENSWEIQ
jgi:4'-phosphopantetheinyl transferase